VRTTAWARRVPRLYPPYPGAAAAIKSNAVSLAEPIADSDLSDVFARWFAQRGWAPRAH